MQTLIDNWYMILGGILLLGAAGVTTYRFWKLPKVEQIEKVKKWMLWAVTFAEKELGSGTGKLKLQYVYDMAVQRFPWIDSLISFETFSGWVDEALEEMRKQLETNKSVLEFVNR